MGETNSPSVAHVSYDISPLSRVKLIILTTRLYGQLMSSLLIFKCNMSMSHGTMKYTLKAHVYYFVFMACLLHYLYSLHHGPNILKIIVRVHIYHILTNI
jgi:hypothetical protein